MDDRNFDHQLSDAFRDADQKFAVDGDMFTASVTRRIKRRELLRRCVLATFALIGGAITAFQLPSAFLLLDAYIGSDGYIAPVLPNLQTRMPHVDIKWIAAVLVGFGMFFATIVAGDT